MRISIITICAVLIIPTFAKGQPASDADERSSIVYVAGQVAAATESTCLIDLGAVHTIYLRHRLVVFRPTDGYYRPIGYITVVRADATSSDCRHQIDAQPGDLVMAVREISELNPGERHRDLILRRRLIRSYLKTATSSFNNIRTANALSTYQLQFPKWERSRGDVAGTLMSEELEERADKRLDRLRSQLNLMRRLYQQDAQVVAAAGDPWEDAMALLAGKTAAAAHALRVEGQQDADENDAASLQVAPDELRSRVFDRVFHLEPEQRNTIALVIASLLPDAGVENSIQLRTAIAQTQFPDLVENDQLLDDMGRMLQDFHGLN